MKNRMPKQNPLRAEQITAQLNECRRAMCDVAWEMDGLIREFDEIERNRWERGESGDPGSFYHAAFGPDQYGERTDHHFRQQNLNGRLEADFKIMVHRTHRWYEDKSKGKK